MGRSFTPAQVVNSQNNATTRDSRNSLVFKYKLSDVTANRLTQAVQDEDQGEVSSGDFRTQALGERKYLWQRK